MEAPDVRAVVNEEVFPVAEARFTPEVELATEAPVTVMLYPLPDRSGAVCEPALVVHVVKSYAASSDGEQPKVLKEDQLPHCARTDTKKRRHTHGDLMSYARETRGRAHVHALLHINKPSKRTSMRTLLLAFFLSFVASAAAACDNSSCPSPGCTQCTYPFAPLGAQCSTGALCDSDNYWAGTDYCPSAEDCCYCPGAWTTAQVTTGSKIGCLCA